VASQDVRHPFFYHVVNVRIQRRDTDNNCGPRQPKKIGVCRVKPATRAKAAALTQFAVHRHQTVGRNNRDIELV